MLWNHVLLKTNMKNLPKNNDIYQVYFFTCPAHKPFHFAVHPWVITIKNGTTTRWEVIHKKYPNKERFGYIYKNFYSHPAQGIKKHQFSIEYWDSTLIGSLSGNEKSIAKQLIDFIEEMTPFYPYRENYSLLGPNSNTYIEWILQKFPALEIKLPWNAFGKNFK